MNSLGFSSLSLMPSYDGTFSEGRQINAVGLLGAGAAKTSPFPSLPVSEDDNIKTPFLSNFYIKMIILPRQARDKHSESIQKSAVFLQVNIMWTSNNLECCPDEPRSDIFFQRRLYLGEKNVLFEPILYINDLFTKTGSGQA